MTITKLTQASSEQIKQLLLANQVVITKEHKTYYELQCPSCDKNEAFIDFQSSKHRWIKCNREANCGYNVGLWELIASKQGIGERDNKKMLEYINNTIGQEFVVTEKKESVVCAVEETTNEDQEFLTHCNQIFKNAFKQDSAEVKVSWEYLRDRGYSDNHIKAFNLGYLPNSLELYEALTATPYSYSKLEANTLMTKYFDGVFKWNSRLAQSEEFRNRIVFTWYDKNNNISGFSFRKATNKDVPMKYVFNKEAPRSRILFNINNWTSQDNKKLVIVEGTLDALSANYLSSKEVQSNYFFVAMGGNILTQGQAELLKSYNIEAVILFIDNDTGGAKYPSSVRRLEECNITAAIARIPKEYKDIKDIDELLRQHTNNKEINLMTILEEAKIEHQDSKTNTDAITNMMNVPQTLMHQKPEETSAAEQRTLELQRQLVSLEEPDLHLLKRNVDLHERGRLFSKISKSLSDNVQNKELFNDVKAYRDLLQINYEADKPYTTPRYLKDLQDSGPGLKTGFESLDKYISIQPSTLNFVAGRPSHGKTTVMLNMLRNMIITNPEDAFIFYSYEETSVDIMTKIILSCTKDEDSELNQGENYFSEAKENLKTYALSNKKHDGIYSSGATNLHEAFKEVESWISEGRLQIMASKPNIEILCGAIIERVKRVESDQAGEDGEIIKGKKVSAIFVDYVQKLSTEEEKPNRQQELHKICKDLLDTARNSKVNTAIITGAQANREVKSLETFQLENMREAGDIEQDGNVIIGVWNEEAGAKAKLDSKLADAKSKLQDKELGLIKTNIDYGAAIQKIKSEINSISSNNKKTLVIKILKNRNGVNNKDCEVITYPKRFKIENEIYTKEKIDKNKNIEELRAFAAKEVNNVVQN